MTVKYYVVRHIHINHCPSLYIFMICCRGGARKFEKGEGCRGGMIGVFPMHRKLFEGGYMT